MTALLLLLAAASAIEPGAAKGAFSSDCACLEVEPGVHANRHNTTWIPIPACTHLEYLELSNKPLLSAVVGDGGRVSLAERDEIPATVGRVRTASPDIQVLDQNSGIETRSVKAATIEPPPLHLFLSATTDTRIDAAAIGRTLRGKEGGLAGCVPSGQAAVVQLKVSGGGSLSPKTLAPDDGSGITEDQAACVDKMLKGLKAEVSQKAPGTVHFTIERR